jgi:hypothetical protein
MPAISEAIAAQNATAPAANETVLAAPEIILVQNETMPAISEAIAAQNATAPAANETVLAAAEVVPVQNETIPAISKAVAPQNATDPAQNATAPDNASTLAETIGMAGLIPVVSQPGAMAIGYPQRNVFAIGGSRMTPSFFSINGKALAQQAYQVGLPAETIMDLSALPFFINKI